MAAMENANEKEAGNTDENPPMTPGTLQWRRHLAQNAPFFLRAWLMTYHEDTSELFGQIPGAFTFPVWSSHTDPMCDAGNSDIG
jgi:hypothetical protein